MKKITFIVLFFMVSIIAWCNCDTLFYLHRLNLPDTEETLKMEYLDSLLKAKKDGIDSLLVRKIEIAYNLGRFDIAARTYENLYSNFPENERTLSESLKLQLCYIHGLHYTKRFQECISQCREILHKKKPDSLRYYDTLVDLMLSGFNKHTNWVRVQDYILRNEALLKEAETKGWPQTTINNIKYGLYTMRIREALHNNDFEKALSYADYVVPLSISPAQRRALSTNIAYIYMQLGKYDLAEKCFKDMLEKGVPSFNKGVNLLNYTHMLNLQGRYKETLEILDRYQDLSEYLDNDIYSSYLLGNRAIAESKVLGYDKAFQTLLRSKELGDSISYNSTVQDGFLLFDYSEQAMTIDSLKNSIKNKNILLAAFVTLILFLVAFLCRILRERRQRTSEICALKRSLAETQNKYEKTEEARAELSQLGDSKLASQLLQVAAVEDTLNRIEELVKNKEEDLPQKIKLIGDLVSSSEAKGMVGRNLNIILNRLMQNFLRIFILLTPASLRGKSGFAPIL